MGKVACFDDENELLLFPQRFDLYIIDMESKANTIKIGKELMSIDSSGHFIYISDKEASAYQATKIHAHYFLLKPIDMEELEYIILKVRMKVREESIIIKASDGDRRVKINNVNYIDIVKRCVCYHLKDGAMCDGRSMRTSFEKAVYPLQEHKAFLFIPPSLLINISEIKRLDHDHLQFENDEILYFPRKAYETINSVWKQYYTSN